jgi:hypothetical protein
MRLSSIPIGTDEAVLGHVRAILWRCSPPAKQLMDPTRGSSARRRSEKCAPTNPQSVAVDGLVRQKPVCDNQSHHARENQQCLEGFWDHGTGRIARR